MATVAVVVAITTTATSSLLQPPSALALLARYETVRACFGALPLTRVSAAVGTYEALRQIDGPPTEANPPRDDAPGTYKMD